MMLQNFQSSLRLCPKLYDYPKMDFCRRKKKKPASKRQSTSSADSYASSWRPNSGSLTSSSGTPPSLIRSFCLGHMHNCPEKKKHYRRPLKVSINEKAELIEDIDYGEEAYYEDAGNLRETSEKVVTNDYTHFLHKE
jgi:hypothetical protein